MAAMMNAPSVRVASRAMRQVAMRTATGNRQMWLPGADAPKHLDGTLPGDFGFDPLNLGADPAALKWYVQAELQNSRWAMAAVAGILIPGAIIPGFAQWFEAGEKALPGSPFPFATLFGIQILLMNFVEVKRWQDIRNPGSQGEPGAFFGFEGFFKGTDQVGYPGGIFNPMGMGQDNMKEMQTKEIKNGRLAMLAFLGFVCQYVATGKGPLQNLGDHIGNPWGANFTTNGISIPFDLLNSPLIKN